MFHCRNVFLVFGKASEFKSEEGEAKGKRGKQSEAVAIGRKIGAESRVEEERRKGYKGGRDREVE